MMKGTRDNATDDPPEAATATEERLPGLRRLWLAAHAWTQAARQVQPVQGNREDMTRILVPVYGLACFMVGYGFHWLIAHLNSRY